MSIEVAEKETGSQVEAPITLTEKAAIEVKRIMESTLQQKQQAGEAAPKLYLRVLVSGGGCSGFKDSLELADSINPKLDNVFEMLGVSVVVDRRSQLYLSGACVDYHNDLNKQGFIIKNPNAKTTCGCGSSYSM